MVKNIVLCSDGTGSKGFQKRGTNVFKLYEAVDLHGHGIGPNSPKQVAFYDDGVGTENLKPLKILGGAFGYGLSRNVKQLYANLVRTYEKGDRIYLFGFSRGAFTVRTLAGLINTCGIIKREVEHDEKLLDKVEMAYSEYRSKYKPIYRRRPKKEISKKKADDFRNQHCVGDETIKFIGVWDTVDAVGVPIDELAKFINTFIYRFKFTDSKLSPKEKVKKACHALSIDDERLTFHPVMWDEKGEEDDRIEQVWFAGVHSNVGGGYSKHGMSLVSLDWMMSKAEQAGLRFIKQDRELYRHRRNVTDKLYDSRSGVGVYYRYKPRDIGGDEFYKEYGISTPKIHNSVIERIKQRTEGYAPGNIPFKCEFVPTDWNYENYDDFIKVFSNHHHTGKKSLLDRVKRWAIIRRKFHSAFLISSIIAFCTFMYIEVPELGFFGTIGNLFTITGLIQIAKNLLAKPILSIIAVVIPVIITIVLFVIVRTLRKMMNRDFSEFWYKILK
ncbi:MAG: DUF2235 domain-containing protein [Candidatus Scalindua sediminis]|jgi:uncharacterized protein (DUF2235 family)